MQSEETGVPVLALPSTVRSWARSDITKEFSKEIFIFEVLILVLLLSDQITVLEVTEERANRKSCKTYTSVHCGL